MSNMSELDIERRQRAVDAIRPIFCVSDAWLAELVDVVVDAYLGFDLS